MFEKRRAAKAKAQTGGGTDTPPGGAVRPEEGGSAPEQEARTLSTTCACGHTRKDHTGVRMEVNGRCLECDCEEFRRASETPESHEQMLERARAALARVERLQETALRAAQHPAGNGRRSRPG